MSNSQEPRPEPGVTPNKDAAWYSESVETLTEPARNLLEEYSHIAPEKVVPHLMEVRDKAWEIHPYPCIGMFRFLDLSLSKEPLYSEVLDRVKGGETLLDLGCCFGQELRKLIHDGAPPANLYGSDLRADFMTLGSTSLFLDDATFPAADHFIAADIFDTSPTSPLNARLAGSVDIIYASSFFHLFDWEGQVRAAERTISLLRASPGALLVGRQVGHPEAGPRGANGRFRHDADSWKRMWDEVGERTGTRWSVEATLRHAEEGEIPEKMMAYIEEAWWLRFTVRRL